MFREAALSIAFNVEHPEVTAAASHTVDQADLSHVRDLLLP
jgi:hypothetical protein